MRPQLNLLCWEGYDDADVLGAFCQKHDLAGQGEPLLSDAGTAIRLTQGEHPDWDVVNINNAWIRDYLCQHGMIKTLDAEVFEPLLANLLPEFDRLGQWARNDSGNIVGICQRFGTFNFVVNTNAIDQASAEDQGFALADDRAHRFGVLLYDDFNIFHICIAAGINPFARLKDDELELFSETAQRWARDAEIITDDHEVLNQALIDQKIDLYLSGGVYTVSPARLQGHGNLRAITPRGGPIPNANGNDRGAIVFTEITSILDHPGVSPHASDFLQYLCTPDLAYAMATRQRTLNPVAQMHDPQVFARFSSEQLNAIQWDSLSEDIERCEMYQIPPDHGELLQRLRAAFANINSPR